MYYSIGENTYWYEIYGTGEPLVLLHGFTGSSKTWANFIKDWQSDLQIITVDLPGHGKTDAPDITFMEEACRDLHQLFSHLNLPSFHLLGYSMGGRTALSYTMIYPEKVSSLILESASPGLAAEKEREERRARDEKLAQRVEGEGVERFVDFWEKIPLFNTQHHLAAEKKAAIRAERLAQQKAGLASSLRFMGTGSQPSWWDRLTEITMPTLLLAGVLDVKFTGINKRMHERLPNSQLKIIEEAGHAIHVEQPVIFGKMVREFILHNRITY
ncbi:2-succinyl-6-hydroxy-2,4-cyclohexadiene-1-carboxylate synthase [Virgibacillus sp. YIM 98842]|uniref:2-succinyl-6-hydroxy-2, 4-cyclohexadiene-1-carboxylate synthase n=1 Tax=Virgibacillus sp. YIM 98842 TaxID=2663533 RepID=UPI0013DB88AB|nr:2-succinyl-6-hydroxy-2,4-cyclohexadiene-1-carboxylate synthase [Virgibacillus sp. YIM 98842]